MKKFLLAIGIIIMIIPLSYSQKYQLTDTQKDGLIETKSTSKLGLGFNKLIKDPSMIDEFIVKDGKISFIATAKTGNTPEALVGELVSAGMKDCVILNDLVCGRVNVEDVSKFESISILQTVTPEFKPKLNVGSAQNEGDVSLLTDSVRLRTSLNGNGIKIGILSDSYNALGGEEAGILSGDLPGPGNPNKFRKPVRVLKDLPTGSDEGRAMAELIHDIAPGAELFFYTAFGGLFDFAAGIRALEAAGCDIIVDDVSVFTENYFQDGPVGGAVNEVVAKGAHYFSSAGNSDRSSYEDEYRPSGVSGFFGERHNFSASGIDEAHTFGIPAGASISLWIMWDDPSPAFNDKPNPAPKTDLDAFLFDVATGDLLDFSNFNNIVGGFNIELIQYTNETESDQVVDLLIEKFDGPDPRRIKYLDREEGVVFIDQQGANAGTCVGHSNVRGAVATGASAFFNTPEFNDFRAALGAGPLTRASINGFSSAGGTPILIDPAGNPIEPVFNENPLVVGPDGVNTSFFGGDLGFAPDGFPNFFGTSASAPNIAAVTALLLQADKTQTPDDIRNLLVSTAEDMDDPFTQGFDEGYDNKTGHGFVNALEALSLLIDGCSDVESRSVPIQFEGKNFMTSKVAEVGIYRAIQFNNKSKNIHLERKMATNIDRLDAGIQDGWTLVARTNGPGYDGELLGLSVENGIPFVYISKHGKIIKRVAATLRPKNGAGDGRLLVKSAILDEYVTCNGGFISSNESASITIFPNPSGDVVNVASNTDQEMSVSIYNSVGGLIFNESYNSGEKASIGLAKFGKGNYHAIITTQDGFTLQEQIVVK